jgi:hypothetical protein
MIKVLSDKVESQKKKKAKKIIKLLIKTKKKMKQNIKLINLNFGNQMINLYVLIIKIF